MHDKNTYNYQTTEYRIELRVRGNGSIYLLIEEDNKEERGFELAGLATWMWDTLKTLLQNNTDWPTLGPEGRNRRRQEAIAAAGVDYLPERRRQMKDTIKLGQTRKNVYKISSQPDILANEEFSKYWLACQRASEIHNRTRRCTSVWKLVSIYGEDLAKSNGGKRDA